MMRKIFLAGLIIFNAATAYAHGQSGTPVNTVTTSGTQTLRNKTLDSPTIHGATIDSETNLNDVNVNNSEIFTSDIYNSHLRNVDSDEYGELLTGEVSITTTTDTLIASKQFSGGELGVNGGIETWVLAKNVNDGSGFTAYISIGTNWNARTVMGQENFTIGTANTGCSFLHRWTNYNSTTSQKGMPKLMYGSATGIPPKDASVNTSQPWKIFYSAKSNSGGTVTFYRIQWHRIRPYEASHILDTSGPVFGVAKAPIFWIDPERSYDPYRPAYVWDIAGGELGVWTSYNGGNVEPSYTNYGGVNTSHFDSDTRQDYIKFGKPITGDQSFTVAVWSRFDGVTTGQSPPDTGCPEYCFAPDARCSIVSQVKAGCAYISDWGIYRSRSKQTLHVEFGNGYEAIPDADFMQRNQNLYTNSTEDPTYIGVWILTVFTYDYGTGIGTVYLNGALAQSSQNTNTITLGLGNIGACGHGKLRIGHSEVNEDMRNFNGDIGDVVIWDSVLSDAEIAALYTNKPPYVD